MNRELKFKAYHLPSKTMYWFDIMNGNHGHGSGYIGMTPFGEEMSKSRHRDNMRQVDPTDCELMQFTGLKDSKGKDIYEGDVLNFNIKMVGFLFNGVVEFKNGGFTLVVNKMACDLPFETINDLVVLGNIHENPEML